MHNMLPVKVKLMLGITLTLLKQSKQQVKQLIIAGTITSVCMAFPSISAVAEGFQVFAVIDASGTYSKWLKKLH